MIEYENNFIRDDLDNEEHYRLSLEAQSLLIQGRNQEARDLLQDIVRRTTTGHWTWFHLGVAETRLGDKAAAVAAFEAALLNKPGDEETHIQLGRLALRQFRWRSVWRHLLGGFKASKAADAKAEKSGEDA
jgi:tetratricopeptide (TPR) repeat protein